MIKERIVRGAGFTRALPIFFVVLVLALAALPKFLGVMYQVK